MKTDRKKKTRIIVFSLIGILILSLGLLAFFILTQQKPTNVDITDNQGTSGLIIQLFDVNGNPVEVPIWFTSQRVYQSIIKQTSPPSCTTRTNCVGYATNPNIICWNSQCVLGNIGSMNLGLNVTNPASSQISFSSVSPTSATPSVFFTNLNKTVDAKISPGESVMWMTTTPIPIAPYEGTTQAFQVTVSGTNDYTGLTNTVSGSVSLQVAANPSGSLQLIMVSPI